MRGVTRASSPVRTFPLWPGTFMHAAGHVYEGIWEDGMRHGKVRRRRACIDAGLVSRVTRYRLGHDVSKRVPSAVPWHRAAS